ncbi:exonuclease subunit SbcC [Spirulina subsalsa FACHB-351]|uniref:Nuclease SbcCD subunit C n=1 Tax=Spirulina subsalsa FACHB-351 TaxID=234711 RepID=A0ABT3L0F0_9CYAN|nr:exonuclease subunit SbcC [Spirulina subsalsa]MCW6034966.1 exonuclease subunit SbcC [Spirulina subsalsa FACHB-351]
MIPLQLTLKNFLSYRQVTLDFRGLHTACICGANGAGKSSLLEAITWAVWGQSRAATEDDVINAGTKDVRVDFTFCSDDQTYRIIRSRSRGRSGSLEFQVMMGEGRFRSISGKGVKGTQQQIIETLKLDYDTFVNSAYLRQGRADEFMLRRPRERKQVLADLLKLDHYEVLAQRAKDQAKQYKAEVEVLEATLGPLQSRLGERGGIVEQQEQLGVQIEGLRGEQEKLKGELTHLQKEEHHRQYWENQVTWQQNQYQKLVQDCDRLYQEIEQSHQRSEGLRQLVEQGSEIKAQYEQLLQLRQQEQSLAQKFQAYQELQQQHQELQQQLLQRKNELSLSLGQQQARLTDLDQQEQEVLGILSQEGEIREALQELQRSRQRLQELDALQLEVSPLLERRHRLEMEVEQVRTRYQVRLEQLQVTKGRIEQQIAAIPPLRQRILSVDAQVMALDKKKVYQERVHEKGQERKLFRSRLEEQQKQNEQQIGELQQKLDLLAVPEAVCPLCDRALDEDHRRHVIEKTQAQQEQLQKQIWAIREDMAICERELTKLRQEYSQLQQELTVHSALIQERGQLEAQLEQSCEQYERLQELEEEMSELERSLTVGGYALELHQELHQLNEKIVQLNYDEKTHALIRGEVKNRQWAEIKQSKIEDAKRKQGELARQRPQLCDRLQNIQQQIAQLEQNSDLQRQIQQVKDQITALGYDRQEHSQLTETLRAMQGVELRYHQLEQAQAQLPQVQADEQEKRQLLQMREQERQNMGQEIQQLNTRMAEMPDYRPQIQTLEQTLQQNRQALDHRIAEQGRLGEQLRQLEHYEGEYERTQEKIQTVRQQYRVYQELSQAFGKNGIQALMIENILPQLEAETNQILARLTGNQLHVQFITQKVGKSNQGKKNPKMIDTLEILIADVQGTRAYETYSGGEAFRINFSIRLALARLLAQRSGASLQMLIVDEGFGTQDGEGCDRLIAAINAIASDFACILAVTHMPQFKEAFQYRIEVQKTEQGSQLSVLS